MRPTQRAAALVLGLGVTVPLAVTTVGRDTPQVTPRGPYTASRPLPGVIPPPDPENRALRAFRASRSRVIATPRATSSHRFLPRRPSSPGGSTRPSGRTIRHQTRVYGINTAIADCESGDRLANGKAVHYSYDIHQDNVSGSTASGKYQFINSTWHSITKLPGRAADYSEAVQDRAFWLLWDHGRGAHNWYPSRSCWA